jgi:hypothetical protein
MKTPKKKFLEIEEQPIPVGWHWCNLYNCRMHPAACGIHSTDTKKCKKCEHSKKEENSEHIQKGD